jgi:hypothetical protein
MLPYPTGNFKQYIKSSCGFPKSAEYYFAPATQWKHIFKLGKNFDNARFVVKFEVETAHAALVVAEAKPALVAALVCYVQIQTEVVVKPIGDGGVLSCCQRVTSMPRVVTK